MTELKYGPNTVHVERLIERLRNLTTEEVEAISYAWDAARDAARDGAYDAAWGSARVAVLDEVWDAAALDAELDAVLDAVLNVAYDAVWDAAIALVVRDLISAEHYRALTAPVAAVLGPLYPEDEVTA